MNPTNGGDWTDTDNEEDTVRITITIDTTNPAFGKLDTATGPELRMVTEQAISLVLMATDRLAHLPYDEIRSLFDSDGAACGRVEATP